MNCKLGILNYTLGPTIFKRPLHSSLLHMYPQNNVNFFRHIMSHAWNKIRFHNYKMAAMDYASSWTVTLFILLEDYWRLTFRLLMSTIVDVPHR